MAKTILILFVLAGVLAAPGDLSSCGPFLPETLFSTNRGPFDEARYFGGQLDIIGPRYNRIYLVVAYRYFAGIGLSEADQQALQAKPSGSDFWNDQGSSAVQEWLKLRVTVGAPPIDHIEQFKTFANNAYILNCGDDAFRSAAATLTEHARAGASHDDLRAWVAAQDEVFANCSSAMRWQPDPAGQKPHVPAASGAGAVPWMQADRAYQIAAAEFYAGQFDAAAADFRRIAEEHASPWHAIAPYLAARALIRKATMVDAGAAPAAQDQLRQVLASPDAAPWHESARGLQRYLRVQTDTRGALNDLARRLQTEKTGVARTMNDYRLVLDRLENHQQNAPHDEDITDWIFTFQNGPADHAADKWRTTQSLPWLVAALALNDHPDAAMLAAAGHVPDTSPAYLTLQYHRLRRLPAEESRPELDAILRREMPVSPRNMFLAERMRLARNWDEMLHDAPRREAGTLVAESFEEPAKGRPMRYFDDDAAGILDRQAPLAILRQAAQNPSLPKNLQLEVASAVWVRAIMLNDTHMAKDITPVLASLAPSLKPQLDQYLAAKDEAARAFEAAWLLLNDPGMRPSIGSGAGRLTPTRRIDNFRDNWWCPADKTTGGAPDAAFVSTAQRAEARRQRERLDTFPAAPTFLARQVVEWAEKHPDDPRVPESLRLAVRAARFACGGEPQTDRWAKRAFRLLHGRYPQTDAARRTPYWYGTGRPL
jgi:hypothetical protein